MKKLFLLSLLLVSITLNAQFARKFNLKFEVADYETYHRMGYECYYKYSIYEENPSYEDEIEYSAEFYKELKIPRENFVSFLFVLKKDGKDYLTKSWTKQREIIERELEESGSSECEAQLWFSKSKSVDNAASVSELLNSFKSLLISKSLDQLEDKSSFEINKNISLGTFIFFDKTKNYVDYYSEPSLSEDVLGVDDKIVNRLDANLSKFIKVDSKTSAELSTVGPLGGLGLSISDSKYSEITLTLKNKANRKLKNYGLKPREIIALDEPNEFFKGWFEYLKDVDEKELDNYRLYFVSNLVTLDSLISKVKKYKTLEITEELDLSVSKVFNFSQAGEFSSGKSYIENLEASNWLISFKVDDLSALFHYYSKLYHENEQIEEDKELWETSKAFYETKYQKAAVKLISLYNTFYKRYNTKLYVPLEIELSEPLTTEEIESIEFLVDEISMLEEFSPLNDSTTTKSITQLRKKHDKNLQSLLVKLEDFSSSYSSYETFNVLVTYNTEDIDLNDFTVKTIPSPKELFEAIRNNVNEE